MKQDEFVVEETLQNSIGRYEDGSPINEVHFQVITTGGRNYLVKGLHKPEVDGTFPWIAVCNDYRKVFKNAVGWLKKIHQQEEERLNVIHLQRLELRKEYDKREELLDDIELYIKP